MTVISVNEVQEGTDSIITAFTRGMLRIFLVETDDATTAKLLAETATGIPRINDFYQFEEGTGNTFIIDQTRIVAAIIPEAVEGKPTWVRVHVEYVETPIGFGTNVDDPTLDTPLISVTTQDNEEVVYLDIGGNVIANSAGVTFDPPITGTFFDMVVQIVINEVDAPLETFMKHVLKYNDMLNKSTWLGILPHQGLMKVTGEQASRAGIAFWHTTYQIFVRKAPRTWERKIIDEGYQQIRTTGAVGLEPILDLDGSAITEPRLLDGAGLAVTGSSTGKVLPFTLKDEVEFAKLFVRFSGGNL